MRYGIVEGEPGIFPDPVARVLRAIGGIFRRGEERDAARQAAADEADGTPGPAGDDDPSSDPGPTRTGDT
jgi:hypothetical protein